MAHYRLYLKFTKNPLISYIKSIGVKDKFTTIQSAASYLSRNHSELQLLNLLKFTRRYLAEHFSTLKLNELRLFFNISKFKLNYNEEQKEKFVKLLNGKKKSR